MSELSLTNGGCVTGAPRNIFVTQRTPIQLVETPAMKAIAAKCDALKAMLLEKNRKYGNSALNPCRIFSKASAVEQIKVRIDDKLSRIRNRAGDEDEDTLMDLAGYLVLLMIKRDELAKGDGK